MINAETKLRAEMLWAATWMLLEHRAKSDWDVYGKGYCQNVRAEVKEALAFLRELNAAHSIIRDPAVFAEMLSEYEHPSLDRV